jgi:hypothetical protein
MVGYGFPSNLDRYPPPIIVECGWRGWWMWLAIALGIGGAVVAVVATVQYLRGA